MLIPIRGQRIRLAQLLKQLNESPGSQLPTELAPLALSARTFDANTADLIACLSGFEHLIFNPLLQPGKRGNYGNTPMRLCDCSRMPSLRVANHEITPEERERFERQRVHHEDSRNANGPASETDSESKPEPITTPVIVGNSD